MRKRRNVTEKDIVEKDLENYNDVFADIVNVLLFNGEQVVKEQSLVDARSDSSYKAETGFHTQDKDVSKYWIENNVNVRIALFGFENQTVRDATMPLRVIGYDGAAYREQLLDENHKGKYHPVITLVLYFGEHHWTKSKTLYECLDIKEQLKPYVNDYKLNLFEIAYLSDEQVRMFKSDFRVVADYFVQTRKNKKYIPSLDELRHVQAVFQFMEVMTGNHEFRNVSMKREGGKITMYDAIADIKQEGIQEGVKKVVESMLKNNLSEEIVAKCAGLSIEEIKAIKKSLQTDNGLNLF